MSPSTASAPLAPALIRDLRRRLGEAAVLTDPDRLIVYEADGLPHYRRRPSAVVLPFDTGETAWAVERLHEAGVPVVPRGAGTGLSGGALAAPGSVVLGTARMRRILALEPANRRARVQAGVLNADLSRAAALHGLHYAPDPSSQTACTLGGNVAENSGGPHCLKYGVTSRYVRGLTVVGAGGRVVELGGADGPAAPDLVGLFVGSEGCFGVATEIEVDLVPVSDAVRTLLAAFGRLEDAGAAVSAIIARGLLPAALEILDRATITAVEESIFAAGYPRSAAAVLVVEFDGPDAALDADADRAETICREHGATEIRRAREAGERDQLWKGRKKAFGAMGRLAPDMVVQDATVPRSRLPAVLARIEAIARNHRLHVANVFHAGDGNLHPNILFDRQDPDAVARVDRACREIMQVCVEAGGTITGEHGVGLDKRPYMALVHGPAELDAMERVRRVFDPAGLWNPGKVLPDGAATVSDPGSLDADSPDVAPRPAGDDVVAAIEGDGVPVVFDERGRPRARPSRLEHLAAVLSRASRRGWRVDAGRPFREPADLGIDLSAWNGIEAYEPADLTLTAGAATPLDVVAARTAEAGQWLPIDGPGLSGATLGDVVAGPVESAVARRLGGARDLVLGLTVVTGDGRVLRLGGGVVKNVAGFDLVRLVVGSGGALGVVTSVTVRLHPLAEVDRTWVLRADRPEALSLTALRAAALAWPPVAVELGWGPEGAHLAVRGLGSPAEVAELRRGIAAVAPEAREVDAAEGALVRRVLRAPAVEGAVRLPLTGPTATLDGLLAAGRSRADEAGAPYAGWMSVDRGRGWAALPVGAGGDPAASRLDPGAARWAAGLKRAFDPAGVLPRGPFPAPGEAS